MKVAKEVVKVIIYTSQYKIVGDYYLQPGSRLTDNLNARDGRDFLPITNAEIFSLDGKTITQSAFLEVNKSYIVMVFLFSGSG